MTTPIVAQQNPPIPAALKTRDWCCGSPVTGPHVPGCAYEPRDPDVAPAPETSPEPPPAPPVEVPAAAPRGYGFKRADEFDLEVPSGSLVRYRKLTKSQLLKLNLIEVMDGFTPELLADIRGGDENASNEAALKALTDPERNGKIFGPIDRIVAAAVVIPSVVLVGATTDDQVNVDDVELEDKIAIFDAAIGGQLAALKSVRSEPTPGV